MTNARIKNNKEIFNAEITGRGQYAAVPNELAIWPISVTAKSPPLPKPIPSVRL